MTLELLFNPEAWVALFTLTVLEIVLGVDNLVFISIAVSKLPPDRRPSARKFGLALACVSRILLLLSLAFLASMQRDLFSLFGNPMSIRDLVLIGGGLFLLIKGGLEVRETIQGYPDEAEIGTRPSAVFMHVILQIAVIDIVFSLDSVITAVGMVQWIPVMVAAIIIAVGVMIAFSNVIGDFIDRHATVKMLALAFIILVGVALITDGFGFHIPRGYLYFAMAFSVGVEVLNMLSRRPRLY
ncbi:MAG: TerC family protein [Pseudomarimonas sp.]